MGGWLSSSEVSADACVVNLWAAPYIFGEKRGEFEFFRLSFTILDKYNLLSWENRETDYSSTFTKRVTESNANGFGFIQWYGLGLEISYYLTPVEQYELAIGKIREMFKSIRKEEELSHLRDDVDLAMKLVHKNVRWRECEGRGQPEEFQQAHDKILEAWRNLKAEVPTRRNDRTIS